MSSAPASPVTASMITRDRVRLDADVYRPAEPGNYPVLLMRQPYGRKIASTVCYAHPAWYAAQGYIVVIQDVRGRGTSQGVFRLFADDAADGADAIAWAAGLEGSTGAVGMYGFSYQGVNQLLAAAEGPPALKAVCPAMIGWDLRNDWAYENDAFCLSAGLGWAIQLGAETARLAGDAEAFAALYEASRDLPLHGARPCWPEVMERHGQAAPHYAAWLSEPDGAPYWRSISPAAKADVLANGPPALFIGGWYDTHLPGTVAAYRHYERAGSDARIVIGPWVHFPWGRRLGDMDFGPQAIGEIDLLQVRWFDQWLKGAPALDGARVRLFDMGEKTWTGMPVWPTASTDWRLGGGGRVALDERDGRLAPETSGGPGADVLVHDPWRPVQSVGGGFNVPAGPVDRTAVDARPDVLTYTSEPLEAPLALAGSPTAILEVGCDAKSFDLSCVLGRVLPDGRAFQLTEGYRHFPSPPAVATVDLRPTCITLQAGERLRLSIAGASFPNHPVNPGDGTPPTEARQEQASIITLTIRRDGADACRLSLPVVK